MHAAPVGLICVELATGEDAEEIGALLTTLEVGLSDQVRQWAAIDDGSTACARLVARVDGAVLGYLAWPASADSANIRAHVAVREDLPGAALAAQALLQRLSDSVPLGAVAQIHVSCPRRQAVLREVATSQGFTASPASATDLRKVVVKRHVLARTWKIARESLLAVAELQLPEVPPTFRHADQQLPVLRPDGERVHLSIFQLESLFSPALFCLSGRGGVLVPIQRRFEELLIAQSPQGSFLPLNKAQLSHQRRYLSSPRTLKSFERGDLMFLYESMKGGGSGSVVAVGRVLQAFHRDARSLDDDTLSGSIFTEAQLSEIGNSATKTITVFDNVLRLPNPVRMTDLKAMGCGTPQQLLTAQRLSLEQVQTILEKGFQ